MMSRTPRSRGRARRWLVSTVAVGLVASCGSPQQGRPAVVIAAPEDASARLSGTDISSVIHRPDLRLRDTGGEIFDLRRRPAEEVTLLFFGYTRCRDTCPTVMADLASARRRLSSSEQHRVQVVFVTEDPQRDTPELLRAWLERFDPSIIGLVGGGETTQRALDALKTSRTERAAPSGSEHWEIEHSGSVYAFIGTRVVVYTGGTTPAQYAQDLRVLLRA